MAYYGNPKDWPLVTTTTATSYTTGCNTCTGTTHGNLTGYTYINSGSTTYVTNVRYAPVTKTITFGGTYAGPPIVNRKQLGQEIQKTIEDGTKIEKLKATKVDLYDGISAAECYSRYKLVMKELDKSDSRLIITRNEEGRRHVVMNHISITKKCEGNKTSILSHVAELNLITLTPNQFEAAQKEWSRLVKEKEKEAKSKYRLQVVVDDSVPGYID